MEFDQRRHRTYPGANLSEVKEYEIEKQFELPKANVDFLLQHNGVELFVDKGVLLHILPLRLIEPLPIFVGIPDLPAQFDMSAYPLIVGQFQDGDLLGVFAPKSDVFFCDHELLFADFGEACKNTGFDIIGFVSNFLSLCSKHE